MNVNFNSVFCLESIIAILITYNLEYFNISKGCGKTSEIKPSSRIRKSHKGVARKKKSRVRFSRKINFDENSWIDEGEKD